MADEYIKTIAEHLESLQEITSLYPGFMALLGGGFGSFLTYRKQKKLYLATCSDTQISRYISKIEEQLDLFQDYTSNYWNPQKKLNAKEKAELGNSITKTASVITRNVTALTPYLLNKADNEELSNSAIVLRKLATGGTFQQKAHKADKTKAENIEISIYELNKKITKAHSNIKFSKSSGIIFKCIKNAAKWVKSKF